MFESNPGWLKVQVSNSSTQLFANYHLEQGYQEHISRVKTLPRLYWIKQVSHSNLPRGVLTRKRLTTTDSFTDLSEISEAEIQESRCGA